MRTSSSCQHLLDNRKTFRMRIFGDKQLNILDSYVWIKNTCGSGSTFAGTNEQNIGREGAVLFFPARYFSSVVGHLTCGGGHDRLFSSINYYACHPTMCSSVVLI